MREIDLNCDLGEGVGNDDTIMPLITSANVSCAAHAGTEGDIFATLCLARKLGVIIGAHPGYPDPDNFGRVAMDFTPRDLFEECSRQLNLLLLLAKEAAAQVVYLKPHGALFHQTMRDPAAAEALVTLAKLHRLTLLGLPGSQLALRAKQAHVPYVDEGYADRRYRIDGSLIPRTEPDAFVQTIPEATQQVQQLVKRGIRSICVHGDNPQAVQFLRELRDALSSSGYTFRSFR